MGERKFHGFGKETENGFLLFLFADAFDFVAAERTEIEIFPAAAEHAGHTIFAHDFLAMGASMRDGGRGMPRAKQNAILQNDWRRFENGNFDLWNRDVYIGRFDEYFNVAD